MRSVLCLLPILILSSISSFISTAGMAAASSTGDSSTVRATASSSPQGSSGSIAPMSSSPQAAAIPTSQVLAGNARRHLRAYQAYLGNHQDDEKENTRYVNAIAEHYDMHITDQWRAVDVEKCREVNPAIDILYYFNFRWINHTKYLSTRLALARERGLLWPSDVDAQGNFTVGDVTSGNYTYADIRTTEWSEFVREQVENDILQPKAEPMPYQGLMLDDFNLAGDLTQGITNGYTRLDQEDATPVAVSTYHDWLQTRLEEIKSNSVYSNKLICINGFLDRLYFSDSDGNYDEFCGGQFMQGNNGANIISSEGGLYKGERYIGSERARKLLEKLWLISTDQSGIYPNRRVVFAPYVDAMGNYTNLTDYFNLRTLNLASFLLISNPRMYYALHQSNFLYELKIWKENEGLGIGAPISNLSFPLGSGLVTRNFEHGVVVVNLLKKPDPNNPSEPSNKLPYTIPTDATYMKLIFLNNETNQDDVPVPDLEYTNLTEEEKENLIDQYNDDKFFARTDDDTTIKWEIVRGETSIDPESALILKKVHNIVPILHLLLQSS